MSDLPQRFKVRRCKDCGTEIKVYMSTQNRCRDCALKKSRPIKQRGKQALKWELFRDKVARPHLDKRDGIGCHKCGVMPPRRADGTYGRHDVQHRLKRGSHPDLKFDVNNLEYLCRDCHIEETDQLRWSKVT